MKIFFPFKRNWNSYLDEIEKFSQHSFIYGFYKEYSCEYKVVNIHWPESIFDWVEPTDVQLQDLHSEIQKWKKNATIIYTKHDRERLKGSTQRFSDLFQLIEKNSDIFIHLGEYSKKIYESMYPEAIHKIVFHPLYENTYKKFSKKEAREKLDIGKDALVIIAPGSIRNFEERKMVISAFDQLNVSNKVLISNNMRTELKYDFPGRVRLKKIFDVRRFVVNKFKNKYQPPTYLFSYGRISNEELSLRMSASDIVLIPRTQILNSGNLFLALTFNKVIVGPATGNLEEFLTEFNMPVFNPGSIKSVVDALEKGIYLFRTGYSFSNELEIFKPEKIALEMDSVFTLLK